MMASAMRAGDDRTATLEAELKQALQDADLVEGHNATHWFEQNRNARMALRIRAAEERRRVSALG